MSCGVGSRCGLDLALLWLCRGPVAIAPIGPLAWELPCALGVALERQKTEKKTNKEVFYKQIYYFFISLFFTFSEYSLLTVG